MSSDTQPICEICQKKKTEPVIDMQMKLQQPGFAPRFAHESCFEKTCEGKAGALGAVRTFNEQKL